MSTGTSPRHIKPVGPMSAGALVGVGAVAAIDEIVFHQLLGWHHFYDRSTPFIGLVSDGVLHAFELLCMVAGFTALIHLQRVGTLKFTAVFAGLFYGMGAFQLFDGIVNHKILRIHQIRYGVDILPYDILWNTTALTFLLIGGWIAYRDRATRKQI